MTRLGAVSNGIDLQLTFRLVYELAIKFTCIEISCSSLVDSDKRRSFTKIAHISRDTAHLAWSEMLIRSNQSIDTSDI